MTGQIKLLTREKGFGFIRGTDNNDYFFHRSGLIGIEFDTLQEGDEVEFQPSKGPKGLRAENVQYGV
jgi:CspA family cold shock protein